MDTKYTMTVLQHTVEYSTENIYDIDVSEIEYEIKKGKKSGILASKLSLIIPVGTWKIVNPWKDIADKLYSALLTETSVLAGREDSTTEALKQYEQLKEKDGKEI